MERRGTCYILHPEIWLIKILISFRLGPALLAVGLFILYFYKKINSMNPGASPGSRYCNNLQVICRER